MSTPDVLFAAMGRVSLSTRETKRRQEMREDADTSPGSSSCSNCSKVTLPQPQCPGIQQLTGQEIADTLERGTESKDSSFTDEVAMALALLREGKIEDDSHRPYKRIHVETSVDALLLHGLSTNTELLPSEDRVVERLPISKVPEIGSNKVAAKMVMNRNKLEGTQDTERINKTCPDWADLPPAQQPGDAVIREKQFPLLGKCSVTSWTKHNSDSKAVKGPRYSCGLVINCNGPWFLDDAAYVALVKETHEVPHLLVKHVPQHPGIQQLFEEARTLSLHIEEKLKLRVCGCRLKLIPEAVDPGDTHFHAFLKIKYKKDLACTKQAVATSTMKMGDVPVTHSVPADVKRGGRKRCRELTESHDYCQADRIGQVMPKSSVPKSKKLFPAGKMINALRRHRKMTTGACKDAELLSRDRASPTLAMLGTTKALEYSAEPDRGAGKAATVWKSLPFKEPTQGEREWLSQHCILAFKPCMRQHRAHKYVALQAAAAAHNLRRFKFLIYDGLNRMGKTQLACSWFGSINTLICNAQNCTTPNMRPLLSGRYSAVLFDEGDWQLCFQNKAMMQASSRTVELGQSQCNDRSYQVLLYRVPLIVCSNDFWAGCTNNEARLWIEQNSIYIRIDSEVWVKPAEAVS
jgi:hypothetical protein